MKRRGPNFRSVVIDVDSTLSAIEGIDWLAARKGSEVAATVAGHTARAMTGEIALEEVYAQRIGLVAPGAADIDALARAYIENIAPGAKEAVSAWVAAKVRVIMVSGGIRQALLPLAEYVGVPEADVYAVAVHQSPDGNYASFDTASPLAVATGKRDVVAALNLPRPVLSVGDGATDIEMKAVTDAFAAFTGFAVRPLVTARADYVVASFEELSRLVG